MTERQKEKLKEILEKYPNYELSYGEDYFVISKHGVPQLSFNWSFNWNKKWLREYHIISQMLFNEVLDVVEDENL